MRAGFFISSAISIFSTLLHCDVDAAASDHSDFISRGNPLNIDLDPAPSPEDGPALSAGALRDPAYLPAQIGAIVGSYAFTLCVVAIILLSLSKRRREHLRAGEEVEEWEDQISDYPAPLRYPASYDFDRSESEVQFPDPIQTPISPTRNFSYPVPISPARTDQTPYLFPSPVSSKAPGVDLLVDQAVVAADRQMAQQQLEDMYKFVMEQEEAKEAGVPYEGPPLPSPPQRQASYNDAASTLSKKEKKKSKPTSLNLNGEERPQSRTSSLLSVLKSPRKKKTHGISISSPIMTPMSGTFPRSEGEEMSAIPPRHYAPAAPPPVPSEQASYLQPRRAVAPITPDVSPQSTMSIDERIGSQLGGRGHSHNASSATTQADPVSAVSDSSTEPLVGLPSSPKPGSRFPSGVTLPASPKPGSSFSRTNPPSAVRTGGALPLRAYEPSLASPSATSHHTKETVFQRTGPLSPGGGRTPMTGAPVPYTPYQPFSPVVPITPSLVTKADRKRMKRFEPKTPTVEMVKSSEEIW